VPASIARPLTEGLRLPTICTEDEISHLIPQTLLTCRQAIGRALDRVRQEQVDTCWSDAGQAVPPEWSHCGDSDYSGGTLLECGYRATVAGSPETLWPSVARLGGQTGYYAADILWWLRGVADRLLGGVGLRRGRRSAEQIRPGDPLDFWRVLEVDPPTEETGASDQAGASSALSKLVLLGEMKTPGQALLEVCIQPLGKDGAGREQCRLSLLARFLPRGIFGIAYWYLLYPVHQYIFSNMLRGMAGAAGLPLADTPLRFTPKISPSLRRKMP
ncbi:MAG: SDR family oxidoreductase, partial [Desulfovibrionales bacterium]|nr:SDR family oxidoreductase [Desulfovibrionales bacterium]